jgi:microfibrillar-associated protein 1
VFSKKSDRDARVVSVAAAAAAATVATDEDDAHLDAHAKQEAQLKQLRREQARGALLEDLRQEEQNKLAARQQTSADDGLDNDPTEPAEQEAEYAAWRLRELARVKRDLDERRKVAGDAAEVARRRNMTDEEIMAEDRELLRDQNNPKTKMRFMQRYYHEGAFFRGNDDEADILQGRDFTAPTEQDMVNKSILPEAMQVRRGFGLAGHTRYTHLADQDTTDKGALWFADRKLANQYSQKLSGTRGVVDRDDHKKRRTGDQ